MRLASQRHLEIFSRHLPDMTPTQFSILVRLRDVGEVSQNQLGRLVAMDAATTKGVISRLIDRGLVQSRQDGGDLRRLGGLDREGRGVRGWGGEAWLGSVPTHGEGGSTAACCRARVKYPDCV